MTIVKRLFTAFSAFVLCAVLSLGSLSFMPKANAVSPVFYSSNIPTISGYDYIFYVSYTSNGSSYLTVNYFNVSSSVSSPYPRVIFRYPSGYSNQYALYTSNGVYGSFSYVTYLLDSDNSIIYDSAFSSSTGSYVSLGSSVSDVSFYSSSVSFFKQTSFSSDVSSLVFSKISEPISSTPLFYDFQPFYFPEMPHGYFDGNINVVDGSYSIDFPSNASISGAITQTGNDHYTWTWNHGTLYWNGETVQGEHEGWLSPDYQHQTPPNGDITQTAYANRLITLSLSDLDSVVNYNPAYNENSRFRCWSCVMDSSYVWFVSDTRNKITGSIVSVTSDEVTWKYEFSDPQGGNTLYPTWAIVFSPMGEVIQVLSPTTVSNKNTYTLSCSIGTLEQDQDTGIWSCDPLYHGFWFSNDSPPVANITHLNVAENKKYLANPVFGESAFQLQFLDSINRGIADINSNIQSLQSAMQSSISGQTSDFQNMDAPSAPQPSTSQMMDYFSKESAFSAPNTDEVFSGDIKSGHYWDGVTWWSSKFNDIIVSNQVIVAFTTAMLTLGLAVLIIGRRFSMR